MTLTRTLRRLVTLLPAILPLAQNLAHAQAAPATIASKATGFERRDGFIPVYVDAKSGKLLLELPRDSTRALLMVSQATGFGSNPSVEDRAHWGSLARDIDRWLERGEVPAMSPALVAPPGDPFGIPN